MRARLEAEVNRVAPMPQLEPMAILIWQTGLSYSELRAMPKDVLDDLQLLKAAEQRAAREKE